MALDSLYRGNASETKFADQVGAAGNQMVVATASGQALVRKRDLYLREKELSPILADFQRLPAEQRQPKFPGISAAPPERPLPEPPKDGLRLRGYCQYMRLNKEGWPVRADVYYYQKNPNRWKSEPQTDILWMTKEERLSLLPKDPQPGMYFDVPDAIQQRFFRTIGIDYMEGSIAALEIRDSGLKLVVTEANSETIKMRLSGYAKMGRALDDQTESVKQSRGCDVKVTGVVECDRTGQFSRFDVAGVGTAWGHKRNVTYRELGVSGVWMYGIAVELIQTDRAMDNVPPYNLLHYDGGKKYFAD